MGYEEIYHRIKPPEQFSSAQAIFHLFFLSIILVWAFTNYAVILLWENKIMKIFFDMLSNLLKYNKEEQRHINHQSNPYKKGKLQP